MTSLAAEWRRWARVEERTVSLSVAGMGNNLEHGGQFPSRECFRFNDVSTWPWTAMDEASGHHRATIHPEPGEAGMEITEKAWPNIAAVSRKMAAPCWLLPQLAMGTRRCSRPMRGVFGISRHAPEEVWSLSKRTFVLLPRLVAAW